MNFVFQISFVTCCKNLFLIWICEKCVLIQYGAISQSFGNPSPILTISIFLYISLMPPCFVVVPAMSGPSSCAFSITVLLYIENSILHDPHVFRSCCLSLSCNIKIKTIYYYYCVLSRKNDLLPLILVILFQDVVLIHAIISLLSLKTTGNCLGFSGLGFLSLTCVGKGKHWF